MWREIKWSTFDKYSFDWKEERIKNKLIEKILPWARYRAEEVLRYIKSGVADYIREYWRKGNYKKFYLIFNGLFFKEPIKEINKYKEEIEKKYTKVSREEETYTDEKGKPYIWLFYYYVNWDDSDIKFRVELDCYKKGLEEYIYKEAERLGKIWAAYKRPLDDNLVWAFLEWRCSFNILVLQCLWINKL